MRRREASVRAAQYIPCLNATVDLKTGELLPHRKEDMITNLAKVRYDKEAGCPMWKQFVREIMDYITRLVQQPTGLSNKSIKHHQQHKGP